LAFLFLVDFWWQEGLLWSCLFQKVIVGRPGSISVRGYPLQRCQRFQLICHLPAPGCYALPVTVGGSTELFEPQLTEKAFDIFPARSFASGDW